jgi:hypothetical protein
MEKLDVLVCQTGCSSFQPMQSATIYSAEPDSAKSDGLVSEIRGSRISRNSDKASETMMTDPDDWRTPMVHYLKDPSHITDRKVQQEALKYVMLDNTLHHRTIDDLLLKCLGSEQSKIAMGKFTKVFVVLINQLIR